MQNSSLPRYILTASLVFVFGYFGIDKFIHPFLWIQWIPTWMDGLMGIDGNVWLTLIGAFEVLVALLLLIPKKRVQQIAVVLVIVQLIGILTQTGWNDIAVRDIGLLMSAVALFLML